MACGRTFHGFPAIARAGQFGAVADGANFPHGPVVRSSSSAVSPFTSRTSRSYSGSAAALNEEAAQAAFPSPPRRRVVSPTAYRLDLPTVGRRRASPVMVQDRFLQAAARVTFVIHDRQSARLVMGRVRVSSALHPRAVSGASQGPKVPSPEVTLPGPFVTSPSPVLPVAIRWLLTSVDNCGVRARCSVRMRFRTGRFQR